MFTDGATYRLFDAYRRLHYIGEQFASITSKSFDFRRPAATTSHLVDAEVLKELPRVKLFYEKHEEDLATLFREKEFFTSDPGYYYLLPRGLSSITMPEMMKRDLATLDSMKGIDELAYNMMRLIGSTAYFFITGNVSGPFVAGQRLSLTVDVDHYLTDADPAVMDNFMPRFVKLIDYCKNALDERDAEIIKKTNAYASPNDYSRTFQTSFDEIQEDLDYVTVREMMRKSGLV